MKPRLVTLSHTLVLAIGVTAMAPSPAAAQAVPPGGAPRPEATQAVILGAPEFARMVQGKKVVVTTSDGTERRGEFETSPTGLVMKSQWKDGRKIPSQTVPFDQIRKVEKSKHRIRNGVLIGLASGLALGLGVFSCIGDECTAEEAGQGILMLSAVGAGAGTGIGALLNSTHRSGDVLYDARPPAPTVTIGLAPILSPTRKGVGFSMSWR